MNLYEAERLAELLLKRDRLTEESRKTNSPPKALLAFADAADLIQSEIIGMIKSPNKKFPQKDLIIQHSVGIGLGRGCSAGLSDEHELLIAHFNDDTQGRTQINFGHRTRAQVDELLGYIARLKIHLPE